MSTNDDSRRVELLCDRALVGLSDEEATELEGLLGAAGDTDAFDSRGGGDGSRLRRRNAHAHAGRAAREDRVQRSSIVDLAGKR